jgi:hypothetical protein
MGELAVPPPDDEACSSKTRAAKRSVRLLPLNLQ